MSTKTSSKRTALPSTRRTAAKNGVVNVRSGAGKARESRTPLQQLLDRIVERGKQIPPEELANIPRDFAMNLEHYMYGAPKETE